MMDIVGFFKFGERQICGRFVIEAKLKSIRKLQYVAFCLQRGLEQFEDLAILL